MRNYHKATGYELRCESCEHFKRNDYGGSMDTCKSERGRPFIEHEWTCDDYETKHTITKKE